MNSSVLHPEIFERLHDYLAGIFDQIDSYSLRIGSATDHVHLLFALSENLALCQAAEYVNDERYVWD